MMKNISIYQILLIFISVSFLLNGLIRFVKKESGQTFFKFFATALIWGTILFFSLFPGSARLISENLGMGSNLNTFIFIGFVIVFLAIFKIIHIIQRIEKDISSIVRKEALKKIANKKYD